MGEDSLSTMNFNKKNRVGWVVQLIQLVELRVKKIRGAQSKFWQDVCWLCLEILVSEVRIGSASCAMRRGCCARCNAR
jgi:hypothetical protein